MNDRRGRKRQRAGQEKETDSWTRERDRELDRRKRQRAGQEKETESWTGE